MDQRDVDQPAETYGDRWAEIYDDEHSSLIPSEDQLSRLAALAGNERALELGIGTGRVALPLAGRGVDVEGLDASPAMVARLRAKVGADALAVVIGDMAEPAVVGPFRLVYVVFNTFFGLLTQERQVACFRSVAGLLEPEGVFLLECFVPDLGRFDRGQCVRTLSVGDDGVRLVASRHDPVGQVVDSSVIRLASDATTVLPVRLRYAWPAELDLMARLAGLELKQRSGGWAGEAFTGASTFHVSTYGR